MPNFKDKAVFNHNTSSAFDALHPPGTPAPNAGIYRCDVCKHEIGIAEGHVLPPQIHAQHPQNQPIRWKLVACAVHNK